MIAPSKSIVILTQYYPPETGAPQERLSSLARRFAELGFGVTVLTASPNYPIGKIYPGYKNFFSEDLDDNIRIIRTPIWPTKSLWPPLRIASYLSFAATALFFGLFLLRNVNFLITESPPLFLGITGYVLSRLKKAKWIFNVSDLWPESAVTLGVISDGLGLKLALKLEKFCYEKAFLVTCQSLEIQEDIQRRFPKVRTYHLPNGVDVSNYYELATNAISKEGCVVAYAGLHGLAQGLDQILAAASKLKDISCKFVLMGDGPGKASLVKSAKEMNLNNVDFLESKSPDEARKFISSSDMILVPLKRYIRGAIPSKLYEAMASGRPVIFIGEGEAANIVNNHQCGIVVTPGDIPALVHAVKKLSEDTEWRQRMGSVGKCAAKQYFDRPQIEHRFIEYLQRFQ